MSRFNQLLLRFVAGLFMIVAIGNAQSGELVCQYFPGKPSKTQVWLLNADITGPVAVSFSREDGAIFRKKHITIDSVHSSQLLWALDLPPGSYHVEMRTLKIPFFQWNTAVYCPKPTAYSASSLLLNQQADLSLLQIPPVSKVIDSEVDMLYYKVLYSRPNDKQLTVRAILYKKESTAQGETFTSLEQKAEVLTFKGNQAVFSGSFRMVLLEAGTYLVEILAYEDDRIIPELERNQTFTLQWSGIKEVLAEPHIALRKMKHITDPVWLEATLKKGQDTQVRSLLGFWEKRNPAEPGLAMTTYFQRILTAERLFRTWDCDQARIFVLHGRATVQAFSNNTAEYERWSYDSEGLVFLFRKEKGTFVQL